MEESKVKKLSELSQLYKEGILTKEELEQEKKKILDENHIPRTIIKEDNTYKKKGNFQIMAGLKAKYDQPSFWNTFKQKISSFTSLKKNNSFLLWIKNKNNFLSIIGVSMGILGIIIFFIYFYQKIDYSWEEESTSENIISGSVKDSEEIDSIKEELNEAMISKGSINVTDSIFRDIILKTYNSEFYDKLKAHFSIFSNVVFKNDKYWAESGKCLGSKDLTYALICYNPTNKKITISQIVEGIRLLDNGSQMPKNVEGWDEFDFDDEICKHYSLRSEENPNLINLEIFQGVQSVTIYTDLLNIKDFNLKKLVVRDNIFNREFRIALTKEYVDTYEGIIEHYPLSPNYAWIASEDWGKLDDLTMCLPDYTIILEDMDGNVKKLNNPKNLSNYHDVTYRWFD